LGATQRRLRRRSGPLLRR